MVAMVWEMAMKRKKERVVVMVRARGVSVLDL